MRITKGLRAAADTAEIDGADDILDKRSRLGGGSSVGQNREIWGDENDDEETRETEGGRVPLREIGGM